MLTEDDKKLLTEFLGECWWGLEGLTFVGGIPVDPKHNRTFTTGNDMLALNNRLVEVNRDGEFFNFAFVKWMNSEDDIPRSKMSNFYFHWLLPNFAGLVAEFLKKEVET